MCQGKIEFPCKLQAGCLRLAEPDPGKNARLFSAAAHALQHFRLQIDSRDSA